MTRYVTEERGSAGSSAPPLWATRRRTWWAAAMLLASLAALTLTDAWLESHTGDPVGMPMSSEATKPDLWFGYEHIDVVDLLDRYGPEGRRAYGVGLVADTIYPLSLAAAAILVTGRTLRSASRWLWIPPLAIAVLDVAENALLGGAVFIHPDISAVLVLVASPIAQAKLLALVATVILLAIAVATAGNRRLRKARLKEIRLA